jgi:hypothetical protein
MMQTCIVHLLRNSLDFVSFKDRKSVATALKDITCAVDAEAGETSLTAFEASDRGRKYPAIAQSWRRAWPEAIRFFAFQDEVRRIVYTGERDRGPQRQAAPRRPRQGRFPQRRRRDQAAVSGFDPQRDGADHAGVSMVHGHGSGPPSSSASASSRRWPDNVQQLALTQNSGQSDRACFSSIWAFSRSPTTCCSSCCRFTAIARTPS